MEFILDFQGFKNEKEFVIKELAIISTDGTIYELQLFLPPCSLHELPTNVIKRVHWIEKHLHGLYWSSGFKEYSQIKDIFKYIDIKGNVYVKGLEKQTFIAQLLSEFDVKVINLEDLGCPKLSVLKQRTHINFYKPCSFSHTSNNCAYINVHVLLQWWNMEKQYVAEHMKNIDAAIKEWSECGSMMEDGLIKYLPKEFIISYVGYLESIYDKLPPHFQSDPDILNNLRCKEHYQFVTKGDEIDGPVIKRKYCHFCRNKITSEPHSDDIKRKNTSAF